MVRSRKAVALISVAATTATLIACGSDAADLGPGDPGAIIEAALPTAEDLALEGIAEPFDLTLEDIYPVPDPAATPMPIPERFASCDFSDESARPDGLLDLRARWFMHRSLSLLGQSVSIGIYVFGTKADAEREYGTVVDNFQSMGRLPDVGKECLDAMASSIAGVLDGSATMVVREREAEFDVRGVEITQSVRSVNSSAGLNSRLLTRAVFVHEHVVATYSASEIEEGTYHHEDLIRTLVRHVVEALERD